MKRYGNKRDFDLVYVWVIIAICWMSKWNAKQYSHWRGFHKDRKTRKTVRKVSTLSTPLASETLLTKPPPHILLFFYIHFTADYIKLFIPIITTSPPSIHFIPYFLVWGRLPQSLRVTRDDHSGTKMAAEQLCLCWGGGTVGEEGLRYSKYTRSFSHSSQGDSKDNQLRPMAEDVSFSNWRRKRWEY